MKKFFLLIVLIVIYRGFLDWYKFSYDQTFINNNKTLLYNLASNDSVKSKELSFAFHQIVEKKHSRDLFSKLSNYKKKAKNKKISSIQTNKDVKEVEYLLPFNNPVSNSLKYFIISQRYLNKFTINERSKFFKETIRFAQTEPSTFFKYTKTLMTQLDDSTFEKQKRILADLLLLIPDHKEEINEIAYDSLKYNIENNDDPSMLDSSSLNLIIKSNENDEELLRVIAELTNNIQNDFIKNKIIQIVSSRRPKLNSKLSELSGLRNRIIASDDNVSQKGEYSVDNIPEGIEYFEAIEFHDDNSDN